MAEGDTVRRGQILAELENTDYRPQVESAEAEAMQKQAELRNVIRGAPARALGGSVFRRGK